MASKKDFNIETKRRGSKLVSIISFLGSSVVSIIVVIAALFMILYSAYALYDTFYINRQAFTSSDLMQYRPKIEPETDGAGRIVIEDAKGVNPDYRGWLTIEGTNIDYPVLQGKDDLEYASKNFFGETSISGSIYLATDNDGEFKDLYSLLYGHHMDNGAMFGDVDNYLEEDFLKSHKKGLLVTESGAYDLNIFAVMKTHAYEGTIYTVSDQNMEKFNAKKEFIRANAVYCEKDVLGSTRKILAMSTCASISTNGRIVIFADMIPHEGAIEVEPEPEEETPVRKPTVRNGGIDAWALVNLIALICTVYLFLPLFHLGSKFRRNTTLKNINEDYNELLAGEENGEDSEKRELFVRDKFSRRSKIGFVAELVVSVVAIFLFILTEDMRLPMILVDEWTIWMILLYILLWALDVWLMRWRRKEEEKEEDAKEA